MKLLILAPAIILAGLFTNQTIHYSSFTISSKADTNIIHHQLDGSMNEWPNEKFETNKETNISYAIDNDAENLFVAMRVPDFGAQMKMMRQGMNLYIDLKGKKKEGRGIEFPVKRENGFSGGGFGNRQDNDRESSPEKRAEQMKAVRSAMALNLLSMKVFGFDNNEPKEQGLKMDNTANIAFNWDSSNVMFVEYAIPLKMLDEKISSLNQKNISLGWKINGVDNPTSSDNNFGNNPTSSGGGRGGSRGGGLNHSPGSETNKLKQDNFDSRMKEQSFWAKYTFVNLSK